MRGSGILGRLRSPDGSGRPCAAPFVLDAARGRLWGQVRPGGAHELVVERRLRGGSWRTFAHVRTDARGYWTLRRRVSPGAAYRYRVDRTTSAVRRR